MTEDKDDKLQKGVAELLAIVREAKVKQTAGKVLLEASLNGGVTQVTVTKTVSIK